MISCYATSIGQSQKCAPISSGRSTRIGYTMNFIYQLLFQLGMCLLKFTDTKCRYILQTMLSKNCFQASLSNQSDQDNRFFCKSTEDLLLLVSKHLPEMLVYKSSESYVPYSHGRVYHKENGCHISVAHACCYIISSKDLFF